MRVPTRIVCRLVLPLLLAVSPSSVEGKRTAVRGLLDGDDEQGPRVLKGSKKDKNSKNNERYHQDGYDYYYPWDMHKYGPRQRPPKTSSELSTKATEYHRVKKRSSSSKSRGRSKGGKGTKTKLSRSSKSNLVKNSTDGRPTPPPADPPNGMGPCSSSLAELIASEVPEVVTRNPAACCDFDGPQAVYVTHALKVSERQTLSGFETFWDEVYREIANASNPLDVCFVMTGIDRSISSRSTDDILLETVRFVSTIPSVVSMMVTDPTENVDLITEIRSISDDLMAPSIGVFNAKYDNVIIEGILSGRARLPYVGYLDEAGYGTAAAQISLDLLDGVAAQPLCFNARIGVVDFIGERCAAYYSGITSELIQPEVGVACSANSTATDLSSILIAQNTNAVWSHGDCCTAIADAAEMLRRDGKTIVVGCMDEDTSGGRVDFVTAQPIALQAYSAASWANFPVIQAQQHGRDGRVEQYFPGLQSLVNTAIFNQVFL